MPTLVATPCPSGPVVVSMPDVQRYSGWPGHLLSSWRKRLMSSRPTVGVPSRSYSGFTAFTFGQMQHRIQQHRGVADREHEPVPIRPDRICRIETKLILPERIRHRRHGHRSSRVAGVGLLHAVHAERANCVYTQLIDFARRWLRSRCGGC